MLTFYVTGFKVKWPVAAARILAGALAGGLLLLELLAANGAVHQALHHSGEAAPHHCVLCLLAQGQMDSPQSEAVLTVFLPSSSDPAPRVESIAPAHFTYLASLGRAPPAQASLHPVVA